MGPGTCDDLLVDCGATAQNVTNKSKFISFDDSLIPDKEFIELADGSRANGIVNARGKASMSLHDTKNNLHNVILENALYIPSFKQDIFSVQAATEKGVSVVFGPKSAQLKAADGTLFNIKQQGRCII